MPSEFPRLFEPGRIGAMEVKNRLIMAAMGGISGADHDGYATSLTEDYFEARARGGIGCVVVGSCAVDWPLGSSGRPRLSVHDDSCIPGLRRVADAISKHGATPAMQLQHAGPSHPLGMADLQPVAASERMRPPDHLHLTYWGPRALSVEEIHEVVESFARAAARAKEAGFKGVELNAGHRYLINSFLSPYWNERTDEYGGSLENRVRILVEIIEAIRRSTQGSIALWCKINGEEPTVKGGITPAISRDIATLIEKAGADAITVSTWPPITPSNPPGYALDYATGIKGVVKIPVIAMGRVGPQMGARLLERGEADFIAVGRAVAADPEYPNKIAAGQLRAVTPCIYCNSCNNNPTDEQLASMARTRGCTVNPSLTREREYAIVPAERQRKIVVIGGGPAGLEAARIAALRGHSVTLFEKDRRLGGKLLLAALVRDENVALIAYFEEQMRELGVDVKLGMSADVSMVQAIGPHAVVVAVGANAVVPEVRGIDRANVITVDDIQSMMEGHLDFGPRLHKFSLRRVLWFLGCSMMRFSGGGRLLARAMRFRPFGKSVLVVGRQLPGIELAEFLMRKGTDVSVVDTRDGVQFGEPPMPVLRQYLEERLNRNQVPMIAAASYESISKEGLGVVTREGARVNLKAKTIIFTGYYEPNTTFSDELRAAGYEVHTIGDCAKPYGMLEAIDAGASLGRQL